MSLGQIQLSLEQIRIQVLSAGRNIVALQLLNWWLQTMTTVVVSAVMIYMLLKQ